MLHIKSNSEPVVGVDTRTGMARPLGSLEFISGTIPYGVDINSSDKLRFVGTWSTESKFTGSQRNLENELDTTRGMTTMSFDGSNTEIFLDVNTSQNLNYFGVATLKLNRNGETHNRETDAFSVRVEHVTKASLIPSGESLDRPVSLKLPSQSVEGEGQLNYAFTQTPFAISGYDYVKFYNEDDELISHTDIGTSPVELGLGDSTWINLGNTAPDKNGIRYYIHDVYIKSAPTRQRITHAIINFTTSGKWKINFSEDVINAYYNLTTGKMLRFRFVYMITPVALENQALAITSTFLDDRRVARPSVILSQDISEDGFHGTFKFNRPCYVTSYLNNVQIGERVLTTSDGTITIPFPTNVHLGASLELRLSTMTPVDERITFNIGINDTVAPPPIVATLFTSNRIFGSGGNAGDFAVALRDYVEIGRATIGPSLEYLITVNEGVTLVTGDLIEVYAMDAVGNESEPELYEIEVAETSEGTFNPALGNDAVSAVSHISQG